MLWVFNNPYGVGYCTVFHPTEQLVEEQHMLRPMMPCSAGYVLVRLNELKLSWNWNWNDPTMAKRYFSSPPLSTVPGVIVHSCPLNGWLSQESLPYFIFLWRKRGLNNSKEERFLLSPRFFSWILVILHILISYLSAEREIAGYQSQWNGKSPAFSHQLALSIPLPRCVPFSTTWIHRGNYTIIYCL